MWDTLIFESEAEREEREAVQDGNFMPILSASERVALDDEVAEAEDAYERYLSDRAEERQALDGLDYFERRAW